jgi:hypothetical protein
LIIGESFQFKIETKDSGVEGIGTVWNITILPASRQVFIEFHYEREKGEIQQLSVDLDRFFKIISNRQSTLTCHGLKLSG